MPFVSKRLFFSVFALLLISGCFPNSPTPPPGVSIRFEAAESILSPKLLTAISPDAEWGLSPAVRISPDELTTYQPLEESPTAVVVDGSGRALFLGTRSGKVVQVERLSDERRIAVRTIYDSSRAVSALALSNDGKLLAVAQYSYVGVIDLEAERLRSQLTLVDGRILSLDWDPRGELLALGRANGDVFVWDGESNDTREIERYSVATSPVVGLKFHPKARAFFMLERSGGLYLWRVIRTEYQLGLRDETAKIDEAQQGRLMVQVGVLPQASALWVSPEGNELLALAPSGTVFSWSVRGLQRNQSVPIGELNAAALSAVRVADGRLPVLAVGGRGQQLQIWCRAVHPSLLVKDAPVPVVEPGETLAPKPPEPLFSDDEEDELDEEEELEEELVLTPPGLIASTPTLEPTLRHIASDSSGIWVSFSDGSIARLSTRYLNASALVRERMSNCVDSEQARP